MRIGGLNNVLHLRAFGICMCLSMTVCISKKKTGVTHSAGYPGGQSLASQAKMVTLGDFVST